MCKPVYKLFIWENIPSACGSSEIRFDYSCNGWQNSFSQLVQILLVKGNLAYSAIQLFFVFGNEHESINLSIQAKRIQLSHLIHRGKLQSPTISKLIVTQYNDNRDKIHNREKNMFLESNHQILPTQVQLILDFPINQHYFRLL